MKGPSRAGSMLFAAPTVPTPYPRTPRLEFPFATYHPHFYHKAMKRITKLHRNQIFVFGSNLSGRHGAGAALDAWRLFGAEYFKGDGSTGRCYAIPTKGHNMEIRSLEDIQKSVEQFLFYAWRNPDYEFIVTPIGCGLAGYKPEQIKPMFAAVPENVILPDEFK